MARRFEAVRAHCERRASDTSWPEARKRLQANEVYRTIPNTMHNVEFVDYDEKLCRELVASGHASGARATAVWTLTTSTWLLCGPRQPSLTL